MKLWYTFIVVFVLVCGTCAFLEFFGRSVSGTEFSPDTFSIRKFNYRQSPFSGTIRGKRFLNHVDSDCESLIALNLIPASKSVTQRWDLVSESIQSTEVLSGEFDARFITRYLTYKTDTWNRQNIEKAEILWPHVVALARQRLYLVIPRVLSFALNSSQDLSNEMFETRLNKKLGQAWLEAAKITAARAKYYRTLITFPNGQSADDNGVEATDQTYRFDGEISVPILQPATAAEAKQFYEKAIEFDPDLKEKFPLEKLSTSDSNS